MNVVELPVAEIQISQARARKVYGNVDQLAESIKTYGLLQPIIVYKDNKELVAGGRRLEAHKKLGKETISVVFREEMDELDYREVELEENIQRLDMSWAERTDAIAEIDRIKRKRNHNWGLTQTAQVAGLNNKSQVSAAVNMSKMMALFPEIRAAKSFNQAKSWAEHKAKTITRIIDVQNRPEDFSSIEAKIVLGDSREVIKTIPDGTFNAIITDPPFGIDYNSRKTNIAGVETAYEDSAEFYETLLAMAPDLYRVLKPDGWFVWFLGISWYARCVDVFESAGFNVDPVPIIWNRSKGKCHTNRPDRYFTRGYDIALHMFKGNPQMVVRGKSNVLEYLPVSVSERELLVERPVELYEELIKRLTVPGELVADFFVGSGSCPAAAARCGRQYFGVEQNPERRAVALQKIRSHTPDGSR